MSTIILPPPPKSERDLYPTLGPAIAEVMEQSLVHGPGDLRGEPFRLDDEFRGLLNAMYEVFPKGHSQEGRRRFRRCAISLRKGSAKTEFAAAIAAMELHPEAPVRCDGWRRVGRHWEPVGRPVTDPFVPMIAVTEEQSDELAFGALLVMLSEGPANDLFDPGLERIMRRSGDGKAVSLATAPDSNDGARTTFEIADETHRLKLERQRAAWRTMLNNLPKRRLSDAWAMEITTAFVPGEGSVAESTWDYAHDVMKGKANDTRLFFFHRQASDEHDLTTKDGLRAAVIEASGPVKAAWSDIDGIVETISGATDPADRAYAERVWLNRPMKGASQAFDVTKWKTLAAPEHVVEPGADIVIGFDGSRTQDSTALVGVEVITGHVWVIDMWERPPNRDRWEVPIDEVNRAMTSAFDTWAVWRLHADPPHWEETVATWSATFGSDRVVPWPTYRQSQFARLCRAFSHAIANGELTHANDLRLTAHVGNSQRVDLRQVDEEGQPLWRISKAREDSPHKIDAAVAAILAWEARTLAVAAGVGQLVWRAV